MFVRGLGEGPEEGGDGKANGAKERSFWVVVLAYRSLLGFCAVLLWYSETVIFLAGQSLYFELLLVSVGLRARVLTRCVGHGRELWELRAERIFPLHGGSVSVYWVEEFRMFWGGR